MSIISKIAMHLQCNRPLNKRAICLKRSWDEVATILDRACSKKCCGCSRSKKR